MNKEEFLQSGLLEEYLLGLINNPKDIELVKQYLDTDSEVLSIFKDMEARMLEIADENGIAPPDRLRTVTLEKIGKASPSTSNISTPKNIWPFFTALLILLGIVLGLMYRDLKNELEEQKVAYASLEDDCNAKAFVQQGLINFFNRPEATTATIQQGDFVMSAIMDPASNEIYLKLHSGTPPSGKTFVVWGDKDHKMIKIGDLKSMEGQVIAYDNEMVSLNVTIEDAGIDVQEPDVSNLVGSVAI